MKAIDDKDCTILNALQENAKLSTQQVSRKTRIPITTVHNRIKKLEASGVIKGYTTVIDDKQLGNITAFILMTVMYHLPDGTVINQEELAAKVKRHQSVQEVYIITGSRDLIARVRVKSVDELNDFVIKYLRSIPGIERTETDVVLKSL